MTLEQLLSHFPTARRAGKDWKALCPAHADVNPSLSISERDGKLLLCCHAGCSNETICERIGIRLSDLSSNGSGKRKPEKKQYGPIVAKYDYMDIAGNLLYQVTRHDPKDFLQRRPDGKGGWIWGLGKTSPILYNLPEVTTAKDVFIVEGEKDVETLRKLGICATCNPMGAGSWRKEYSETLRGKNIVIIADNDKPGQEHAITVATSLHLVAAEVKLITQLPMPDGHSVKDVTEWIEHGFTREALLALVTQTKDWNPDKDDTSWKEEFHTPAEFENTPELRFAINGFVQCDGITMVSGLSGQSKTWILLSIAKALLAGEGTKLWGHFLVQETAPRVVYLIPEVSLPSFAHRVRLMGLMPHIQDERLVVRTLSKGPVPDLGNPRILAAMKDAHGILDTATRFSEGDENSAGDNARGLATDIFGLIAAGARSVIAAHHSPKSFARETMMTLEGVLRGSGDIGAMVSVAWGVKQLDAQQNIIHIECIKARDFEPCKPFQLQGRPFIDETGDFKMIKDPGVCGSLRDEQPGSDPNREKKEQRADRVAMVRSWFKQDAQMSAEDMIKKFEELGITVKDKTVYSYRKEALKS